MIIKTAIALFLTASLAGGAVYYGTHEDAGNKDEVSLGEHPQAPTKQELESQSKDTVPDPVDPRSSESIVDRFTNKEPEKVIKPVAKIEESNPRNEEEPTELEPVLEVEAIDVSDKIQLNNGTGISENNFVELNNKDALVEQVLHEIQKIESVEIKDQAYFDLVMYSLENKMYSRTGNAILSIENPAFRDSARGEYALGLIKDGQIDAAFIILDGVETDKLRDILKLKAIQAMIGSPGLD